MGAHGVELTFASGRRALCGTSGLWNVNLGYGNRAIAEAVGRALHEASYLGVFRYENPISAAAAQALVERAGAGHYGRVHFTTSGGSANDLVMKVARQYHALRGEGGRRLIVGLQAGYHGLTFGSFALTTDDLGHRMYGIDQSLVRHVPVNDSAAVTELVRRHPGRIAAVVVEPVQGTGAVPLTADYLQTLGQLRDQDGFLLVADEVATGFGRIDGFFASGGWRHRPDLLVTSKGLTNGTMGAAAVLMSHAVAEPFEAADVVVAHAETQAGTAVVGAAILATLAEMDRLAATDRARAVSGWLDEELADLCAADPRVAAVRGAGCFRALAIRTAAGSALPAAQVMALVAAIREEGAVVHPGPDGVQLIPALIFEREQIRELVHRVGIGLDRFASAPVGV